MKTPSVIAKISRRQSLALLLSLPLLSLSACASPHTSQLLEANNLQELSQEASVGNLPILLFVTAPECRFCHQLERDVMAPMLKNPRYPSVVILRRLNLGKDTIIDWQGVTTDTMKLAGQYRAQLTPTLLFLSPSGEIIADKIQGVGQDTDQYGGMIDARINLALEKLGSPNRITH